MKVTYEYETGKFTRDFKIIRLYDPDKGQAKCKLSGLPCWVNSEMCKKCPHYGGLISYKVHLDGFYLKCDHPEQKDSENIGNVISQYYDYVKEQALIAYYD